MSYLLTLDQGTSSCRSVLSHSDQGIIGVAQQELPVYYPHSGWVEQDASEIWQIQLATAKQVLFEAGVAASALRALGITNQRETVVLWDAQTGVPVHRAIVWQDRRTDADLQGFREAGHEVSVRERTGLRLDAYFSASKIAWILREKPELRARAQRGEVLAGTVDSWLVFCLTGGLHITDVTNASRTLLWNIHGGEWDEEMLALFDVPRAMLAEVVASSGHWGDTKPEVLGAAVPICGLAGDQQAALFGQACLEAGQVKTTYGTGCFLLMHTGEKPVQSEHGLLTTVACQVGGQALSYALEGSVFMGGATVQWLRDYLQIIAEAKEMDALAGQSQGWQDLFFVPALVGLSAPHWDAQARGLLIGIEPNTSRADIAWAALEGIAWQVVEVLRAMQEDVGVPVSQMAVDGGATASELLMGLQADTAGVTLRRCANVESTALGATFLAGLAAGLWSSPEQLRGSSLRGAETVFEPRMAEAARQQRYGRWQEAVRRAAGWKQGAPV